MTSEEYIDDRFKNMDGRYRHFETQHPKIYILRDHDRGQEYELYIKQDDWFAYAQEIIEQGDNMFIMYKPGSSHYVIRFILTGEEFPIQSKETCKRICGLLNELWGELHE